MMDLKYVKPGMYRHYKGAVYHVLCAAYHTETADPLVIYRAPDGKVWCRPYDSFMGRVEVSGKMVNRFEIIED